MQLHATPYDISAVGFYFDDLDEYEKKAEEAVNEYGDPVEEFEIQFIDGTNEELALFKAMGVHQGNLDQYFEVADEFDDEDATKLRILMGDMGYGFDEAMDKMEDLILYGEFRNDVEFAQDYVDSFGSIEDALGDRMQYYFDYDSFGRDLRISGDLDDPDADEDEEPWYEGMTDQEIGEQFADDVGWEGVGKNTQEFYFDWDMFARDLMFDMSEMDGIYYDPRSV